MKFRGPHTPIDLVSAFGSQSLSGMLLLQQSEQSKLLFAQAHTAMQAFMLHSNTPPPASPPKAASSWQPPQLHPTHTHPAPHPPVVDLTQEDQHSGEGGRGDGHMQQHPQQQARHPQEQQQQEPQQETGGRKPYSNFRSPALAAPAAAAPSAQQQQQQHPSHPQPHPSGGGNAAPASSSQYGRAGTQHTGQQGHGKPPDQPRWADHKPAGKRPAPGYGQRGGEDIDDDSDGYLNPGPGTNPGMGAGRGFQSAKTAMIADCRKKGIQPPPSMTSNSQVPRSGQGLRPPKKQAAAGHRGFVSPMGGKQAAGPGGGGGEQEECAYPPPA
ncbi:MAG: hypothetical protein WDW38_006165 [Sanguina aurantia]